MSFSLGTTFLNQIPNTPTHWWIIVSDPQQNSNKIVIVNSTSWKGTGREDSSCILEEGEHPFLKQKSYIIYDGASFVNLIRLKDWKRLNKIKMLESVSEELLGKILAGAKTSPFLKFKYKDVLEKQGLI